jgi:hypothetical protein
MNKRISDTYNLIEETLLNQVQQSTEGGPTRCKVCGKFQTNQIIKLQAMMKTLQIETCQNKTQDSVITSSFDQFFPCATCGCTKYLTVNYIYQQQQEGSICATHCILDFLYIYLYNLPNG